jgi:hypothetical protein
MPKSKSRKKPTKKQNTKRKPESANDPGKQQAENSTADSPQNTGPAIKGKRSNSQPRSVAKSFNRY